MVREIPVELQQLRGQYNPEKPFNIVQQMRIIHKAVDFKGTFEEDVWGLANYLGISQSKVNQLKNAHTTLIPEMKQYLVDGGYEGNMAYKMSVLSPEAQQLYLDSSKQTINEEK